jgi:hypothetical protein
MQTRVATIAPALPREPKGGHVSPPHHGNWLGVYLPALRPSLDRCGGGPAAGMRRLQVSGMAGRIEMAPARCHG